MLSMDISSFNHELGRMDDDDRLEKRVGEWEEGQEELRRPRGREEEAGLESGGRELRNELRNGPDRTAYHTTLDDT